MDGNFWKQFGDTYDQVNSTLGGLPDMVKGIAQKAGPAANALMSNFDQTMMQSPAGQIGIGIGGKIADAIVGPGSSDNLINEVNQGAQSGRQTNPIAAGIGTAGGLVGQMLSGPTTPMAEAGTAAARLAPTIGRNLLNTAAVTVPGAISQGAQTGDWGTAIKQGAQDTALGGLVGSAGEKIIGALPSIVNAAKKTLMGQAIRGGMDINPGVFSKIVTYGPIGKFAGSIINRADDLKQQLVDLMIDNPAVKTEAGRAAVVKAMDDKWGQVDQAFNQYKPPAGMGKVRSFQNQIMAHPLVQDVLNANPDRLSDLDAIISKADTGKDLGATRHILQKDYIDPSFAPGSKTDDEQVADLARGVHDVIDDNFVPDNLKATYARDKVLKEALSREDLKLPQATQAGSPTFARLAADAALGGMGGEGMGLMSGQDPTEALQNAAMMSAAGVIGGVGGRLGSRAINKGISGGQARLSRLLGQIPEGTLEGVTGLAPRIAQAAGRIPQMAQTNAAIGNPDQSQVPPSAEPIPNAPAGTPPPVQNADQMEGTGGLGQMDTTQQLPTQPAPLNPSPENAKAVDAATSKEQELTPEQVQNARTAVGGAFQDQIKSKILRDWQNWQNPFKPDFDKFYQQALNASSLDGVTFDPKNENTARIIAGPNYKDYLKAYNVALDMQSLGKNLGNAISYWGVPLGPGGAEAKQMHDKLVNTLYTAMTGDMKEPDKPTRQQIENRLFSLRRERLNPNSQKQKLLDMMQKEYGVRFDILQKYGIQQ